MDQYETFLKIVSNGNISKTADELGYSQSNISHMLMSLENELDCTLLNRSRNGVRLTTEGELLLPYFNEICNAHDRLREKVRQIHGLLAGKIRIGTFASVSIQWLPLMIKSFHEKYPAIEFELLHGSYKEIETWVNNGSADCGFVRMPTEIPLDSHFLKEDPFYAIVPEGHPFEQYESVSLQMLTEEAFIFLDDQGDHDIEPFFRTIGRMPDIRYSTHDVYTVMSMVKVGLGVTMLAGLVTDGFNHIVRKPLTIKATRRIGIAIRNHPSAAAAVFVQHARGWIEHKYNG